MPTPERFLTTREGDTLVLTPIVNLSEVEYTEAMTQGIIELLADSSIKNLVIDFHRTDYFGSTALGSFIRMWKSIQERQGRMAFCNLSAHQKEILAVTKLDAYWTLHGTKDEAVVAVKA
jgi:anti-anti-sigma factor